MIIEMLETVAVIIGLLGKMTMLWGPLKHKGIGEAIIVSIAMTLLVPGTGPEAGAGQSMQLVMLLPIVAAPMDADQSV